jgi:hypothetical protein
VRKSVILLLALSVSLAGLSCLLAVKLVDAAFSLDHARMEKKACRERAGSALMAANQLWSGASIAQAESFGRRAAAQGLDVQKQEGRLLVGDIQFNFAEGHVKSLTWIQEASDEHLRPPPDG